MSTSDWARAGLLAIGCLFVAGCPGDPETKPDENTTQPEATPSQGEDSTEPAKPADDPEHPEHPEHPEDPEHPENPK